MSESNIIKPPEEYGKSSKAATRSSGRSTTGTYATSSTRSTRSSRTSLSRKSGKSKKVRLISPRSEKSTILNEFIAELKSRGLTDFLDEEYEDGTPQRIPDKELRRREVLFKKQFETSIYEIKRMKGDGACFFRAIADQLYENQDYHLLVRLQCMDHIKANREAFKPFIMGDFDEYITKKSRRDTFADNLELQVVAEMYKRNVELYQYNPSIYI